MSGVAADYTLKAASLSRRLRQIQAGLADAPAETRLEMLDREIGRELADQSDLARRSLLEIAIADFAPGAAAPSGGAPLADDKPEALADKMLAAFSRMSEVERQSMLERLSPMLPPTKGVDRDEVVRDVAAFFKLPPEQVHPQRVGELCAVLLRLAQVMEPVWQIWDELAPLVMRSPTTPTITQAAPGFLQNAGADQREKESIAQEGRRLGRVVAQLLLQVKPASKKFADELAKELSPRRIEEEADKKKTAFGGSDPWGAYKAKQSLYDKDELCERVLEAVRELVQRSIR